MSNHALAEHAITAAPLPGSHESAARAPAWAELDTKGYLVIRSFLTPSEIDTFAADYETVGARQGAPRRDAESRSKDAIDVPYKVRHPSAAARATIDAKLAATCAQVTSATTLHVDTYSGGPFGSLYFTTDGDVGLSWHQDSVSYFAYQNHHDYLNFYIPIVKPVPEKSNLCVVPFDRLSARSPELCARVRGRGATRFLAKRGTTTVYDNARGGRHGTLPYELDELAETPELDIGDLLLLRGDVIHRTQDTDTRRIAISLRMMSGRTVLRRKDLLRGGLVKGVLMTQLRRDFQVLFDCFDAAGKDELTLGELVALEPGVARFSRTPTQPAFLKFLMWNRLGARLARRGR